MKKNSQFIVVSHSALRAGKHQDFRFELKSNHWISFAVPKDVPLKKGEKRLAIMTTIHSTKEALLTGEIKDGYGKGVLKKFDSGSCVIVKYDEDKIISLILKGSKLKGIYHFVNIQNVTKEKKAQKEFWIFKGSEIKS